MIKAPFPQYFLIGTVIIVWNLLKLFSSFPAFKSFIRLVNIPPMIVLGNVMIAIEILKKIKCLLILEYLYAPIIINTKCVLYFPILTVMYYDTFPFSRQKDGLRSTFTLCSCYARRRKKTSFLQPKARNKLVHAFLHLLLSGKQQENHIHILPSVTSFQGLFSV